MALTFEDVEESVAARLTDGDISGILVCIDAVNNLKLLRLSRCTNVRGDGLAPLRGSVVLEKIDLSIVSVEHESLTGETPIISIGATVPILQSIISTAGNALFAIHLPSVWHDRQSKKLCQVLGDLPQTCTRNINNLVWNGNHLILSGEKCSKWTGIDDDEIGQTVFFYIRKVSMDCSDCGGDWYLTTHTTNGTNDLAITSERNAGLRSCSCGLILCNKCVYEYNLNTCAVCKEIKCQSSCGLFHCQFCDRYLCEDCGEKVTCENLCEGYFEVENCSDCAANGNGDTQKCIRCQEAYCSGCREEGVCSNCRDGVQGEMMQEDE